MLSRLPALALVVISIASLGGSKGVPRRQASTSVPTSSPTPTPGGSCAQQAVIANGGFESGLSGWIPEADSGSGSLPPSNISIVSPGHNSNHAVQFSVGYSATVGQNHISACTSTNYTISFDYKVLNAVKTCSIVASAGTNKFNTVYKSVNKLQPVDWTTTSFHYISRIQHKYNFEIGVTCPLKGGSATVQLDNIKVTPVGSLDGSGCPKPVTVTNGGFDTGELAPWQTPEPLDFQKPGTSKIVSPGYNSQYALEMDFAQGSDGYYIAENMTGLCIGEWYMASFAANWVNYTYPNNGPDSGCTLSVLPGSCQGKPNIGYFYPSLSEGWHQYSFPCQASGRGGVFDVELDCLGTDVPAFALQLDAFSISPVGSASPTATSPPTGSPTSASTTSPKPTVTISPGRRRVAEPRWA